MSSIFASGVLEVCVAELSKSVEILELDDETSDPLGDISEGRNRLNSVIFSAFSFVLL